jgi:hypothetical protein
MVRGLPSSNNSKFSGFKSEIGTPVFLSFTSASMKDDPRADLDGVGDFLSRDDRCDQQSEQQHRAEGAGLRKTLAFW